MVRSKGQWLISYDKDSQELTVMFPSGASYDFSGVPPDIAERFEKAESKGSFYNQYIRGQY